MNTPARPVQWPDYFADDEAAPAAISASISATGFGESYFVKRSR